jgi:hypothetical protein
VIFIFNLARHGEVAMFNKAIAALFLLVLTLGFAAGCASSRSAERSDSGSGHAACCGK